MKARIVFAAILFAATSAHAAPKASCVKVVDRAKGAVSALAREGFSPVRAEVGLIAKGKKASFARELDAGTFAAFVVTEEKLGMGLEISALDKSGSAIKKAEGVGDGFIREFAVAQKGQVTIEVEANDAISKDEGHYILVLLAKGDGAASPTDVVFEKLSERAKAVEDAGHEVVFAAFDTVKEGQPLAVSRKLEAGSYAVEVAADDQNVKDLEVDFAGVARKEKGKDAGAVASLKGELKAGEAKVLVTAVFQDGVSSSFAGVLIAKK